MRLPGPLMPSALLVSSATRALMRATRDSMARGGGISNCKYSRGMGVSYSLHH